MGIIKIYNKNCILKGLTIAMLFTIIALSLFSVLLVKTNIGEQTIEPVILVVKIISILMGITIGTKKAENKTLRNGICIAILYCIILYLIKIINY